LIEFPRLSSKIKKKLPLNPKLAVISTFIFQLYCGLPKILVWDKNAKNKNALNKNEI